MTNRIPSLLIALIAFFAFSGIASAVTITGDSLHGATGELIIVDKGDYSSVTWVIHTAGFDDADAALTGHTYLTDVAFKIAGMTDVQLIDETLGSLYYASNVNQASDGCDSDGSKAGCACVTLDPMVLATTDQTFSVEFMVWGDLDLNASMSYRGKFGEGTGWVISESTGTVVPEPSAALVFGIGALIVGRRASRS